MGFVHCSRDWVFAREQGKGENEKEYDYEKDFCHPGRTAPGIAIPAKPEDTPN
jgi:hypothetical protein